MGTWGVGLYQDDVTCDIKGDYVNRLRIGMSNIDATRDVIELNMDFIEDEDDGPLFWFALADTQWKYGRLLPEIKEIALKYLQDGSDLKRWEENKKMYERRKTVLKNLEEELNSPMPPEKKVSKIYLRKAKWKPGDVLLYKIRYDYIKDELLESIDFNCNGKYILFRVLSITSTNIGSLPREYSHEQNVVAIYNWIGDSEPDLKLIDTLRFIDKRNIFGKYTESMYTFSFNSRELKKLDFKVLKSDSEYVNPSGLGNSIVGTTWINEYNMDYAFIRDLQNAKSGGYLKDETMND